MSGPDYNSSPYETDDGSRADDASWISSLPEVDAREALAHVQTGYVSASTPVDGGEIGVPVDRVEGAGPAFEPPAAAPTLVRAPAVLSEAEPEPENDAEIVPESADEPMPERRSALAAAEIVTFAAVERPLTPETSQKATANVEPAELPAAGSGPADATQVAEPTATVETIGVEEAETQAEVAAPDEQLAEEDAEMDLAADTGVVTEIAAVAETRDAGAETLAVVDDSKNVVEAADTGTETEVEEVAALEEVSFAESPEPAEPVASTAEAAETQYTPVEPVDRMPADVPPSVNASESPPEARAPATDTPRQPAPRIRSAADEAVVYRRTPGMLSSKRLESRWPSAIFKTALAILAPFASPIWIASTHVARDASGGRRITHEGGLKYRVTVEDARGNSNTETVYAPGAAAAALFARLKFAVYRTK